MNIWKLTTLFSTGALLVTLACATAKPVFAEQQPAMQSALQALEGAKRHLEAATADKGGHRAKAIVLTTEALEETKKGIAFDNHH